MKILFITGDIVNPIDYGGKIVSINNLNVLRSLPNAEITVFSLTRNAKNSCSDDVQLIPATQNKIHTLLACFIGFSGCLTPKAESIVFKHLKNNQYDVLFLDSSNYGKLAKKAKRKHQNVKIITFFHNVELNFTRSLIKINGPQYLPLLGASFYNEKNACKFSDKKIAINERDKNEIEKIYKTQIDAVCSSIWFDDDGFYDAIMNDYDIPLSNPLEVLFLGAWFYANVSGIKWFIDKVLPVAGIRLTVAGKGMEELSKIYKESPALKIAGTVKNTYLLYKSADCVVEPIFDGSGMKVKTGDAMRHGKTVVGTEEAFIGYNIKNGVEGYLCKTTDDFVRAFDAIRRTQKTKLNKASTEYCKKYLSKESAVEKFTSLVFEN